MKDNEIKAFIGKTVNAEIQKFHNQMQNIFANDLKTLDEKLIQIEQLIKQYTKEQNDDTSRNDQIKHKNNDAPLARNRTIIEAEIYAHKLSFDSNYKHHTKEKWESKLAKLEEELKNAPV